MSYITGAAAAVILWVDQQAILGQVLKTTTLLKALPQVVRKPLLDQRKHSKYFQKTII